MVTKVCRQDRNRLYYNNVAFNGQWPTKEEKKASRRVWCAFTERHYKSIKDRLDGLSGDRHCQSTCRHSTFSQRRFPRLFMLKRPKTAAKHSSRDKCIIPRLFEYRWAQQICIFFPATCCRRIERPESTNSSKLRRETPSPGKWEPSPKGILFYMLIQFIIKSKHAGILLIFFSKY